VISNCLAYFDKRKLKQKEYESEYLFEDYINPYTYNFIYAHESSEQLQNLKKDSKEKYRKELDLNKNNVYLELENCGGIGKNISVTTEVLKPESLIADEAVKSSIHGHGWNHVTKSSAEGEYFTRTTFQNGKEKRSNIFAFNDGLRLSKDQKGISSGGTLKIKVPKEFMFFLNLRCLNLISEDPILKVTVKGVNITDKEFTDVLKIKLDTLTDSFNSEKRYINISLMSQAKID
jgi:hypothetical protein